MGRFGYIKRQLVIVPARPVKKAPSQIIYLFISKRLKTRSVLGISSHRNVGLVQKVVLFVLKRIGIWLGD